MKKIFALLLSVVLICSSVIVYADSFNAVVDSKSAKIGDTVDINISLQNNSGIIAALFNVEYDKERLELIEVQDGQLLEGGTFSPNYKSYPYKMVWNSAATANFTDDGILAVLKFKVLENAQPGKAYINLTYNEDDVFDVDLKNTPIAITNGAIDVTESISGSTSKGGSLKNNSNGKTSVSTSEKDNEQRENKLKEQIILTIGKTEAQVFGETKVNDVAPIIRNDRTMLPARFVAENLGADVKWDNDERKVTITKGDTTIIITIDSQTALVNGETIVLDSPAFIENDRTYIPLRFIAEKLGASVEWNNTEHKVIITKSETQK